MHSKHCFVCLSLLTAFDGLCYVCVVYIQYIYITLDIALVYVCDCMYVCVCGVCVDLWLAMALNNVMYRKMAGLEAKETRDAVLRYGYASGEGWRGEGAVVLTIDQNSGLTLCTNARLCYPFAHTDSQLLDVRVLQHRYQR